LNARRRGLESLQASRRPPCCSPSRARPIAMRRQQHQCTRLLVALAKALQISDVSPLDRHISRTGKTMGSQGAKSEGQPAVIGAEGIYARVANQVCHSAGSVSRARPARQRSVEGGGWGSILAVPPCRAGRGKPVDRQPSWCSYLAISHFFVSQNRRRNLRTLRSAMAKTVRSPPKSPPSRPIKCFKQPPPAPKPPNHRMGGKSKLRPPA
jgi:hypothetical protein